MESVSAASLQKVERPFEAPSVAQLVAETSTDLFRLALRLTGDRADAEDVLQSTYMKAFQALQRGAFRARAELKTWLYRIVVNTAFDERRAAARRERLLPAASAPGTAEPVDLHELRTALACLPADQRAALVLKELHGLTSREAGEVLDRSEGAVEQLLVRARAALKARFDL